MMQKRNTHMQTRTCIRSSPVQPRWVDGRAESCSRCKRTMRAPLAYIILFVLAYINRTCPHAPSFTSQMNLGKQVLIPARAHPSRKNTSRRNKMCYHQCPCHCSTVSNGLTGVWSGLSGPVDGQMDISTRPTELPASTSTRFANT